MRTLRESANPLAYLKQFGFTKPLELLGLGKDDDVIKMSNGSSIKLRKPKKSKNKQAKASRKKNRR